MTDQIISPIASLLPSTSTSIPSRQAERMPPTSIESTNWSIAFVGKNGLPIIQFKTVDPMKVLSNILIELGWLNGKQLAGRLVLPRGLRLKDGIRLKVDGQLLSSKLPLEMLAQGASMVRLTWNEEALAALYNGEVLSIGAVSASNGKPITYQVSLAQFESTANNLRELIAQRQS